MLRIMRKSGQDIIVVLPDGRHLEVMIMGPKDHRSEVGIEAPDDVSIFRREVYDKLIKSPTCLINPNRSLSTLCGIKWESGSNVIAAAHADRVPGETCQDCLKEI